MQQVIQAPGVLQYEQYGFTNCVRFGDVLYLSGISALDSQGRLIGDDIATQTVHTYRNIERVLHAAGSDLDRILQMTSFVVDLPRNGTGYVATPPKHPDTADLHRGLRIDGARPAARGAVLRCRRVVAPDHGMHESPPARQTK